MCEHVLLLNPPEPHDSSPPPWGAAWKSHTLILNLSSIHFTSACHGFPHFYRTPTRDGLVRVAKNLTRVKILQLKKKKKKEIEACIFVIKAQAQKVRHNIICFFFSSFFVTICAGGNLANRDTVVKMGRAWINIIKYFISQSVQWDLHNDMIWLHVKHNIRLIQRSKCINEKMGTNDSRQNDSEWGSSIIIIQTDYSHNTVDAFI